MVYNPNFLNRESPLLHEIGDQVRKYSAIAADYNKLRLWLLNTPEDLALLLERKRELYRAVQEAIKIGPWPRELAQEYMNVAEQVRALAVTEEDVKNIEELGLMVDRQANQDIWKKAGL